MVPWNWKNIVQMIWDFALEYCTCVTVCYGNVCTCFAFLGQHASSYGAPFLLPYSVQLQHSEESWHFWLMLVYFAVSTIHEILICTMQSTCVYDLFSWVYTRGASIYSLIWRTFVESAQYFSLAKSQGGYKAKHTTVTHPFGGHPGLCLTLAFESKHYAPCNWLSCP